MQKFNLTVGAFSVLFARGFAEKDGQIIPRLASLKRLQVILSNSGQFNLKFILPEEGQLGVLTETGYHDGVLGLMQEGKADLCFLPLALDTHKAPGHFTSVISEENFFIFSTRNLSLDSSAVVSSITSVTAIPLLLAILTILILELIAVKRFKIAALLTATFRSFGCYQPGQNTIFLEGISMYDFFKGKVSKEYDDIYKRSVSEGFGEAFPLGPVPVFEKSDLMVTFLSSVGRKLKGPFHKSLRAILFSHNISKPIRIRADKLARLVIQSGIVPKLEGDI
uniref:Uncharacterized protein n=1 Tax=Tetranychus urticae TaxID=32264 RepID=T1KMC3_TETUR